MKSKLFIGLDYPNRDEALKMVKLTRDLNPRYKVGLELYVSEGPDFVRELVDSGLEIFLDLKLHDIPNTVAGATKSAVRLGVHFLTVHCFGSLEMLKAAKEAAAEEAHKLGVAAPTLLGVTVLTSHDDQSLAKIGVNRSTSAQVAQFLELIQEVQFPGLVCSPLELALVRKELGDKVFAMVPGIRPAGAVLGDQKRVATPKEACQMGASGLVVVRPITQAADPAAVTKKILEEMC